MAGVIVLPHLADASALKTVSGAVPAESVKANAGPGMLPLTLRGRVKEKLQIAILSTSSSVISSLVRS